ncbi:MAG TPA: hypothetical protein VGE07_24970 [Herpetosiphonaceae bacterium]
MAESENFYVRILARLGHYNEAEALVKLHRLMQERTTWRDKKRRSLPPFPKTTWTAADQIVLDGIEAEIVRIRRELTDGPLVAPAAEESLRETS